MNMSLYSLTQLQGVPINIIAICYCIFQRTMSFFPLFAAVTVQTMNWDVVMFAGVAVICMVYYFVHGRKVYRGEVPASTRFLRHCDSCGRILRHVLIILAGPVVFLNYD